MQDHVMCACVGWISLLCHSSPQAWPHLYVQGICNLAYVRIVQNNPKSDFSTTTSMICSLLLTTNLLAYGQRKDQIS